MDGTKFEFYDIKSCVGIQNEYDQSDNLKY